jgi:hypothetical protein
MKEPKSVHQSYRFSASIVCCHGLVRSSHFMIGVIGPLEGLAALPGDIRNAPSRLEALPG